MKHRYTKSEYGAHCFRCGVFRHAIETEVCDAKFFPGVTEELLTEAEDWVCQPHDEERNVLAVRAYLAGRTKETDQNRHRSDT